MTVEPDQVEVVKWYTRARKFPQLIGKMHDGTRIWGGPYTFTQVGVGVGVLFLAAKTAHWWGQYGLVGNVLIGATVVAVSVWATGRIPLGARNPLSALAGPVKAFSAPRQGPLGGLPLKSRRPRRVSTQTVITPPSAPFASQPESPAAPSPDVPQVRPAARPLPALSGVQKLLATKDL